MKRLLKNKKAITPVLSSVLMMLIAVAGMSIAITATYVISGNLHDLMGERFIVEDIWFRTNTIAIYVRNTGKVTIKFAAVYVNDTSQSFTALELNVANRGWLNVTYSWTQGTLYHINIASSRGTQVEGYYKSSA